MTSMMNGSSEVVYELYEESNTYSIDINWIYFCFLSNTYG